MTARSDLTSPPPEFPEGQDSPARSASDTAPPLHPRNPAPAPIPLPIAAGHNLSPFPTAATRSSAASRSVCRTGESTFPRTDHNRRAIAPAFATVPAVLSRPTLPAFVPAPPGSAPAPEPAETGRSSVHAVPPWLLHARSQPGRHKPWLPLGCRPVKEPSRSSFAPARSPSRPLWGNGLRPGRNLLPAGATDALARLASPPRSSAPGPQSFAPGLARRRPAAAGSAPPDPAPQAPAPNGSAGSNRPRPRYRLSRALRRVCRTPP